MSRCRSCNAEILWIRTEGGKLTPVDAKPQSGYLIDHLQADPPSGQLVKTFVSHFATCPNAAQHRKPKLPGVE